jgi:hypothetical protein
MFKYFTANGTRKYIDVLPKLVDAYNNSFHRSIKMRPIDVDEYNKEDVFENLYGYTNERNYLLSKNKIPKLSVGDKVRKKYELTPMDKGYYPKWTDVVYEVSKSIKGSNKPMYSIKLNDITLPQKFYPEELQKIKDKFYRIEKIVKRKTKNGQRGFIVKWVGYPESQNSWVSERDLHNVSRN